MQALVASLRCVGRRHNHKVNPCQYNVASGLAACDCDTLSLQEILRT
jgi:hypothetical protein